MAKNFHKKWNDYSSDELPFSTEKQKSQIHDVWCLQNIRNFLDFTNHGVHGQVISSL